MTAIKVDDHERSPSVLSMEKPKVGTTQYPDIDVCWDHGFCRWRPHLSAREEP
jgi:hypothetical protein